MTDDPHKRRKQIEDTLAELRTRSRAVDVQRLTREKDEQEKNLKYAHIDHVRGLIGGAELATVESEAAEARQALADAAERQGILAAAASAEERELQKHLVEHFDVFAADCMKIAERIEANIAKANENLQLADQQRGTLVAKWAPLVKAVKLQSNVPKLRIEPVPTTPLRPPGVGPDGKIIRGADEWGRPLGDIGLDRSEKTARLLEQANREAAEQAARRAGVEVPAGSDAEAVLDSARAMTTDELAEQKEQHKREREANLQAAKG